MDREGTSVERLGTPIRSYLAPTLSPDGQRVAVDIEAKTSVYNVTDGSRTPLGPDGDNSQFPSWSPDGSQISYIGGQSRLYVTPADGSGNSELLWDAGLQIWGPQWSPDGNFIMFHMLDARTGLDVWQAQVDGGEPTPYLQGTFGEHEAVFSPTGNWVAFASNQSGQDEIVARSFPNPAEGFVPISSGGGTHPKWFEGELLYRRGDRVVSVPIEETATGLEIGPREELPVRFPDASAADGGDYDYDPLSRRLIVVRRITEGQPQQIQVVQNWFEELKERVPVP